MFLHFVPEEPQDDVPSDVKDVPEVIVEKGMLTNIDPIIVLVFICT